MIEINFNQDWTFRPEGCAGKEPVRQVQLPHDFSIESERTYDSPMMAEGGFFQGGAGSYTKTFRADGLMENKELILSVDNAYMNCEVYINGNMADIHHYGFTRFYVNITRWLKREQDNRITLFVNNLALPNARWYTGSGIFGSVYLYAAEPVYIMPGKAWAYTEKIEKGQAVIRTGVLAVNAYQDRKAYGMVITELMGRDNRQLSAGRNIMLEPGESIWFEASFTIENPVLWNINVPQLYTMTNKVVISGKVMDKTETKFGIRTVSLDEKEGFLLNGRPMKLKGCCIHHDNGPLGACSVKSAEERKVRLLKSLGYNAVRTVHNPPSAAFLEACDANGMLVVEEIFDNWQMRRQLHDYHLYFRESFEQVIEEAVTRDRSHPSVIMWSMGNELEEGQGISDGAAFARRVVRAIRRLDKSRPVTACLESIQAVANISPEFIAGLDVIGFPEADWQAVKEPEEYAGRFVCAMASAPYNMAGVWAGVGTKPGIIGDFSYTGMDYLGGSGLGRMLKDGEEEKPLADYPWHISNTGDLDICGFVKPQGAYRKAMWGMADRPFLGVLPPDRYETGMNRSGYGWDEPEESWTFSGMEGRKTNVFVYTDAEEAELIINGQSAGKKPVGGKRPYEAVFEAVYEPGMIEAVVYRDGKKQSEAVLYTAEDAYSLELTADRTECSGRGEELVYITCEIRDKNGHPVPAEERRIAISVSGNATVKGVGNGNPKGTYQYTDSSVPAYKGRAMAVIRVSGRGKITITGTAFGLLSGEASVTAV